MFYGFGIGFTQSVESVNDLVLYAKKAEKLGFDSVWVQEGTSRSAIIVASAILQATDTIKVGTGIVSAFRRHPEILAMEAMTLNELSNGRFILGIGATPGLVKKYGLDFSPLQSVKDSINIIRNLVSEKEFTYDGESLPIKEPTQMIIENKSVKKYFPREKMPIYVGALGPKTLNLTGRLADGILVTRRGGYSPEYTKYAISKVMEGALEEGRNENEIDTLAFIESAISMDNEKAKLCIAKILASYTIPYTQNSVLEQAGIGIHEVESIKSAWKRKDLDTAMKEVLKKDLSRFSLFGDPNACIEKLSKYEGTGLKTPIFYLHGPDINEGITLAAKKIIPYF